MSHKDIYQNIWSSITVVANEIINELKLEHPHDEIQFIDWEAHANTPELPNSDLVGPTAVTFQEFEGEDIQVNFAMAVSTYGDDKNLFRHRDYVGLIFERLRPGRRFKYFDAHQSLQKSVFKITPGTLLAPMTQASLRPWQFVQAEAVLVPAQD